MQAEIDVLNQREALQEQEAFQRTLTDKGFNEAYSTTRGLIKTAQERIYEGNKGDTYGNAREVERVPVNAISAFIALAESKQEEQR